MKFSEGLGLAARNRQLNCGSDLQFPDLGICFLFLKCCKDALHVCSKISSYEKSCYCEASIAVATATVGCGITADIGMLG